MNHTELGRLWQAYKELDAEYNKACDKYLALRDAKSDGCCFGMTMLGVLIYDNKITTAYKEVKRLKAEADAALAAYYVAKNTDESLV